ncbi:hypothetical protein ZYGR_0N06150 [Zygosaccharomyces rouxii]|uniref:ZYRO0D14432p n=2 Tax=Zygosaccharomyces rouxii TaxID=4956 RepID=C5DWF5_ZYGRC|nr:uncharacterized protein ZYRO0D14432g [Zygosaccharomyces rouxii]KAH9201036.1 fungal-specific transcription factor domain-containing protein [Zygosaccharomyces rouxii]GAV49208.1 hypothetical protein ZYGR_0N06150 [Zygosaccharomyces rouxii]CAR28124.1 ZYRO0D14432p [Zygosaccharomyces rouxii]
MGRPKKEISRNNLEKFHKELELAGARTELLLQDKKGRSRSCLLCRRRKQKCDHKQPSCTTCLRASVKCIQPVRYGVVTDEATDGLSSPPVTSTSGYSTGDSKINSPVDQPRKLERSNNPSEMGSVPIVVGSPDLRNPYTNANNNSNQHNSNNNSNINGRGSDKNEIKPLVQDIERPTLIIPIDRPKDDYTLSLEGRVNDLEQLLANQQRRFSDLHSCFGIGADVYKNENILPLPNAGMKGKFLPLKPLTGHGDLGMVSSPTQSAPIPSLASDSLDSIDFLKCIFAKYNLKEFLNYDPAFKFEEQISRSLLETFFSRLQFKYPLLDEGEIYAFHDDYVHSNIYSYSDVGFHFACGRLWLVFSISACLSMTTGKYRGEPPVRYFSKAIRHITRCGDSLTYVQQVELLTLLVLYILRTDRDSLVLYDIIRDAMFICKDQLHINVWRPDDPNAHKNLRLFWCVYLLERMICVAVGRPYAIAESEIDLPLFDEVSFNTRTINDPKRQHTGVHFINQSLRLRRIESQFVETLQLLPDNQNRKQASPEQLPLVQKFFHDLEIWRDNCSRDKVRNFENETLKLYYYRSVRLLIQPYLELLTPEDRLFRECQAAAGQICQLYKIFHQKTITGHSTPSVHTVFIAGVTLIYCMWLARNNDDQRRKSLGDDSKHTRPLVSASLFSTMDDLRACSVCLYVMTERSSFARIFRDTFDQLMNATVGNLIERCGPDSSELIYISSPNRNDIETEDEREANSPQGLKKRHEGGMPPATNRIFGTRQAEELAAFVENSQVDPEEQKELKKKQGALEQKSVPESLSHLLIKVEANDKVKKHKPTLVDEGLPPKRRDTKHGSNSNKGGDDNQYIIKKPSTSKEFDWKVFQQQAFLQQHLAQQSLQAYLSSLNSSTKIDQNVDAIGNSINDFENKLGRAIVPPSGLQVPDPKHNTNAYHLDPADPVISTPTWNQNNNNNNKNNNNNDSTNNSTTIPEYHAMPREGGSNINLGSPSKSSPNLLLKKDSNNTTTNLNANILLNNGAQDMITDISTWTTNSVTHLMNENVHKRDSSSQERNSSNEYGQKHPDVPISNNPGNFQLIPPVPSPNINSRPGTFDPNVQSHQRGPMGFSSLLNDGSEPGPSTAVDSQDSNRHTGPKSGNVKLPPTTAGKDFVVEEFWTVNDDYGFLT